MNRRPTLLLASLWFMGLCPRQVQAMEAVLDNANGFAEGGFRTNLFIKKTDRRIERIGIFSYLRSRNIDVMEDKLLNIPISEAKGKTVSCNLAKLFSYDRIWHHVKNKLIR